MSAAITTGRVKALLLAGGLGTRLRPTTDKTPKCLVEISGRPLLDYWFDALAAAGVIDVLINTHHLPDAVRRFIAQKNEQGFRVIETYEKSLRGSAGTIAANAAWAADAENVVIIYADNLSDLNVAALLAAHRRAREPVTILLFRAADPRACGIVELDGQGRVIGFEEKPVSPRTDMANAGVYVVTAEAWREIARMKAFDLGFDVLPRFVGRMRGHLHDGFHRDIGDLAGLRAAREAAPRVFGRSLQR